MVSTNYRLGRTIVAVRVVWVVWEGWIVWEGSMADSKLTENDIMYKKTFRILNNLYIYIKCTCHQLAVAFDDAFLLNIPLRTSFTISTNINPYTSCFDIP